MIVALCLRIVPRLPAAADLAEQGLHNGLHHSHKLIAADEGVHALETLTALLHQGQMPATCRHQHIAQRTISCERVQVASGAL
jgi:hypothetical protein